MMPVPRNAQALRWLVARALLGVGVPLRLRSPDRAILERAILPYFSLERGISSGPYSSAAIGTRNVMSGYSAARNT